MNENVKDWYNLMYPSDELGGQINSSITFREIGVNLNDVCGAIGVWDKIMATRILRSKTVRGNHDVILENPISVVNDESEVLKEFGMMCVLLNSIADIYDVKVTMDGLVLKHFEYEFGFGAFWAKQIINGELSERVIFKQF